MSTRIFQDNIFPRHVSDLMNLMHMVVFNGTDGEEHWQTWLTLKQKECVALGLAQYYQCDHCIDHHFKAAHRLDKIDKKTLERNINSIILFLRIDTRAVSPTEREYWVTAWQRFANNISVGSGDRAVPHLIGLAIGIARDDTFLIEFCGKEVCAIFEQQDIDSRAVIGELESIVIFMKAASSKNRVADKLEQLFVRPAVSAVNT